MATTKSSFLTVVLDLNDSSWGSYVEGSGTTNAFPIYVEALLAYCSAHLAQSSTNKLLLLAAGPTGHRTLFPDIDLPVHSLTSHVNFNESRTTMKRLLLEMLCGASPAQESTRFSPTRFAGALSQALLYANGLRKHATTGTQVDARILLATFAHGDLPLGQNVSLMNVFFTAQKQQVVIDVCLLTLNTDVGHALLQQAADITGGIMIKVTNVSKLLPFLVSVFSASQETRATMLLPSSSDVDYRPACFCHQRLVHIGYVCSVCLSVFCEYKAICPTCETVFNIQPLVSRMKKTKKKGTESGSNSNVPSPAATTAMNGDEPPESMRSSSQRKF